MKKQKWKMKKEKAKNVQINEPKERKMLNREEITKIVSILSNGGFDEESGKDYSDEELDQLADYFKKNIPNAHGIELIFFPERCGFNTNDPTIEEIVDKAMKEE